MKKILLLVFVIVTIQAAAQNADMQVVPVKNEDTFKVFYKSEIKWDLKLAVLNEAGKREIEYDLENKDGFILPIDFSKLKSGKYNIKVSSAAFELMKEIEYTSNFDRFVSKLEAEVIHETKKVLLTLTEPMDGTIVLSIHGSQGKVIDQQEINAREFGMRAFDFSDSESYPVNLSLRYEGKYLDTWTVGD